MVFTGSGAGTVALRVDGVTFTLEGQGGQTGGTGQDPCQIITAGGGAAVTYTNPSGSSAATLQIPVTSAYSFSPTIATDTCANVAANGGITEPAGTYTLHTGSGITITNLPPPSS